MYDSKKDILKAVIMVRSMASAADLWLLLIAFLGATGRHIPWYVWLMFGLEVFIVLMLGHEVKEKTSHV